MSRFKRLTSFLSAVAVAWSWSKRGMRGGRAGVAGRGELAGRGRPFCERCRFAEEGGDVGCVASAAVRFVVMTGSAKVEVRGGEGVGRYGCALYKGDGEGRYERADL